MVDARLDVNSYAAMNERSYAMARQISRSEEGVMERVAAGVDSGSARWHRWTSKMRMVARFIRMGGLAQTCNKL